MFKIEAVQTVEAQERCALACGTVARKWHFAYAMYNVKTGEPMGFAQFDIRDGVGYIMDLKEAIGKSDFEAIFILGRTTMCFIDSCGVNNIYATADAGDPSLLKAIGFNATEDGNFYCDTPGFFDGSCCSGHKAI